jgi:hypothetical protein
MTTDAVHKNSDDSEKPYELIQKIPSIIEAIDTLVNPLFELGDNNEVSEEQFSNKYKDDAVSLAFQLFEKLYESRKSLDALQSVIPVLKDTVKKRDAELLKLQPIVERVKKNTEEMNKVSKELTNISQGVRSEVNSYSAVAQLPNQVKAQRKAVPPPTNTNTLKTAVKAMFHDEDRKKNIIMFGIEENESENLEDEVSKVLLEINQKPLLRQVVRLGQPTGKCRPVRVSLEGSDAVHNILKDSTQLKSSSRYKKVFINPDRTPEQRIKHNELVNEMKKKIQLDSSKRWKISKGGVVSADREQVISAVEEGPSNSNKTVVTEQQVTPPDAADGEAKTPVKEKRRRSHMFRRNRFTLHHSDYESD